MKSILALCFALGIGSAFAAVQTLSGQISDDMCGADHGMMQHGGKQLSARDCTLECTKGGSKYVFVSKGKVYAIDNQNLKDLQVHAGHDVQLTGDLASDGKTLHVSKIVMPTKK